MIESERLAAVLAAMQLNVAGILLATLVMGCETNHATGPYFKEVLRPNADEAIVYFYRPPRPEAPKYSSWIYASHDLIGTLDHGGYFIYIAAPGRYRFSLSPKDNPDDLWLSFKGGQIAYIKWDYISKSVWWQSYGEVFNISVKLVDGEEAAEELLRCRLMERKD